MVFLIMLIYSKVTNLLYEIKKKTLKTHDMYNQNIFDIELCFQWPLQLKTSDQSFLFTLVFGHGKRVFQPLSTVCTMVSNPTLCSAKKHQ